MSMIGWFPLSRFGPGTEITFQTPTSSVWKILDKLSRHNRQREEFDPQDPGDLRGCPTPRIAGRETSPQMESEGPQQGISEN
ncbi:unnamed protein product [Penicillium salamii]|nr:unnamed protein product [Penicillium salamii]